jgi:hypothetical protein
MDDNVGDVWKLTFEHVNYYIRFKNKTDKPNGFNHEMEVIQKHRRSGGYHQANSSNSMSRKSQFKIDSQRLDQNREIQTIQLV